MERDYVTEKVYDGLDAGCLPIYLGAENIADFVPVPGSVVDYNLLGSPERLVDELLRLLATPQEYIARPRAGGGRCGQRRLPSDRRCSGLQHPQGVVCVSSPPYTSGNLDATVCKIIDKMHV